MHIAEHSNLEFKIQINKIITRLVAFIMIEIKNKIISKYHFSFNLSLDTMEFRWLKKKKFFLTRVYRISSYTFLNKKKDPKKIEFEISKIHTDYEVLQKFLTPKRYISFVILINIGDFPHVLLIRSKYKRGFYIPGGRLSALKRNEIEHPFLELQKKLNIRKSNIAKNAFMGSWFFPEKESRVKYPFFPPHIKRKKKEIKIQFVQFKNQGKIQINSNWDLYAVLPFKLFTNKKRYKLILAFFLYIYLFKI
nr:pre-mRNA cleavage factor Im 25 kDa subunit 2-like [Cryptomonas paramecium]